MVTAKNHNQKGMRIAILGHRGIPNNYGGFETFAEELSKGLVGLGQKVVVYCRKNYFTERPAEYKGARLVYLPTITHKAFDTFVHTFISVLHVLFKNTADVVIVVNVGNAPFAGLAKIFGKKVIFCVDGLDWQRKKWGAFARWYLKMCSYLAGTVAHEVVTDAGSVQEFYKQFRKTNSTLIAYGTDIEAETRPHDELLKEYGLEYKKYFIYVARFEPENNPLLVVQAYVQSGVTHPLVMIGDNRYSPEFVNKIKAAANERVIFLGYVFGSRYKQLVKNSLAYIRAAEVGGAAPTIIEAMGRNVCVVANDKPENREILGNTGIFYKLDQNALARALRDVSEHPEKALEIGQRAGQRAMLLYNWDTITFEYFKLIKKTVSLPVAHKTRSVSVKVTPRKKRVLILGASGMLGAALREQFGKKYEVLATSLRPVDTDVQQLDARNVEAVEQVIASFRPQYVVHAVAITNLEQCEKNMADAYTTNALSAKYAAQLATKYGAKMVYVSSSSVFDGTKKRYLDKDEANPINVYGLTKHMGALMTEYYNPDHLILRAGWMMGGGSAKDKKFVSKIVEQIVAGNKTIHAAN